MNSNITGERIKKLRKEHKLTQSELGKIVGVQKSAIAKYERGEIINLKRDTIEKLSKYFDVKPSFLMGMEDTADDFCKVEPSIKTMTLSDSHEIGMITSYRQAPEPTKKAIDVLLGIDDKEK